MIKILLLSITLAVAKSASADTQTNSPATGDISPTEQEILQITPEHIELQKFLAKKIMTEYCSSQIYQVLSMMKHHGDNKDISRSGGLSDMRDSVVDEYLKRCDWMLE